MTTSRLASLQERLVILTGEENYDAWYETVCAYAMANRVRRHLDPSSATRLPKTQEGPPNHANTNLPPEERQQQEAAAHEQQKKLERSKEDEQVAAGIITLSIDQSLRKFIKSSKTPSQMMERLKERFAPRKQGAYSARYKAWLTIHPTTAIATTMRQSDSNSTMSLVEWGELVSKGKGAMVGIGEALPEWAYICAFMRGLSGGEFAAYVDDLLNMLDQRAEELELENNDNDDSEISFEEVFDSFLQHEREVKRAKAKAENEHRSKKTQKKMEHQQQQQLQQSPPIWSVRVSFFDEDGK